MSVIIEVGVPAGDFALGRILAVPERGRVELEALIPLEGQAVPLFWLYDTDSEAVIETIRSNELVTAVREFEATSNRTLYGLTWDSDEDELLNAIMAQDGYLLRGSGDGKRWTLQIRFSDREALSAFGERCRERGIEFEVERVYNPSPPRADQWFGLTSIQRETLLTALREGYFDIPRHITTRELGEVLGVSDQAVSERLRRAIRTLADNSILAYPDREEVEP